MEAKEIIRKNVLTLIKKHIVFVLFQLDYLLEWYDGKKSD